MNFNFLFFVFTGVFAAWSSTRMLGRSSELASSEAVAVVVYQTSCLVSMKSGSILANQQQILFHFPGRWRKRPDILAHQSGRPQKQEDKHTTWSLSWPRSKSLSQPVTMKTWLNSSPNGFKLVKPKHQRASQLRELLRGT